MKLLRVAECANEALVSVPTVYRAITLGQIESVRIGTRGIRVVEESWRKYLETRRRPAINRGAERAEEEQRNTAGVA